jgi:hypothetical protein
LPDTFCKRCRVVVTPFDKGRCPKCGTFLKSNFIARRRAINRMRRDQLLAIFVHEYRPSSTYLHGLCEDLAAIREQLEDQRPGPPDWARLVEKQTQIGEQLEASRRPTTDEHPDVDDLDLGGCLKEIDRLRDIALEMRDAERRKSENAAPTVFDSSPIVDGSPPPATAAPPVQPAGTTTEAAPEPACSHCHQSPARCTSLKAVDYQTWEVLHSRDPEVIKKKDEDATNEMLRMMKYGHPRC